MAGWWISRQIPSTVNCSFFSRLIPLHTASTLSALLYYTSSCSSLVRIFFNIVFTVVFGKNKQCSCKNWGSTQCHKGSCQPRCTWQPMKPMAPNSTLTAFTKTFWKTPQKKPLGTIGFCYKIWGEIFGLYVKWCYKLPSQQLPGKKQFGMIFFFSF